MKYEIDLPDPPEGKRWKSCCVPNEYNNIEIDYNFILVDDTKTIDLSCVVGNRNVICEFRDSYSVGGTGFLTKIHDDDFPYENEFQAKYEQCNILENFWFGCLDDKQPIPDGLMVAYKSLPNLTEYIDPSQEISWSSVISYKVKGEADGYTYGWDK